MFTSDDSIFEYTRSYMYIVMPSIIFLSVMFATNGVINGAGKTFTLMLFSFIALIIIRVPLAYFLSSKIGVCLLYTSDAADE